jgi:hypothetical protein
MRPFITFFGMILVVPGWTLLSVDTSDIINPHFSTPSGSVLWALMGSPHDIGMIHLYGLAIIMFGIIIGLCGLLATPGEEDNSSSLVM